MTVEAEIKARLLDPDAVRRRLDGYSACTFEVYHDTYLDTANADLAGSDRELRLRTIERNDTVRHLLTYKEAAVDAATGSKPEYETTVANPAAILEILAGLGYQPVLAFIKNCRNYRFGRDGRAFLATLATVPEMDGTYLEVETAAEPNDLGAALTAVRAIVVELGVRADELTTGTYTDAVRSARRL